MTLNALLNYELFGIQAAHIIIAITIFSLSFLLKNILSKTLLVALRKLASKTETTTDDKLLDIIEEPLKLSIVLIGTYMAKAWLPFEQFSFFLDNFIKSFFIFIVFWVLYRIIDKFSHIFSHFSTKFGKELHEDIENFIKKTLRFIIIILGVMAVLQEWGINVSAFVASLGLGGLAVALAAKDTVANLFGSLVIFTDRPFKVGDWIETPFTEGFIEEIGIRSTKIRTFAQALVSVPNAKLADASITNWSKMGKRRIKMRIGLTYSTTQEQMQAIVSEIKTMLTSHPDIHKETILISFDEFADSALSIFLYFFTNTINWQEYLSAREDVNFKIMHIVAKHKASFAFPSQSLYIESLPK
ncbi:MAG: mechanosensitive ion channel family protein [Sulfurospirillaceae bacterium]|nr:mechanosensitive ion channel family protein [Sulfurospirillaceae bacterium]